MSKLRSFDAFAKPVEGLRNKSAVGGIITVVAALTASLLFLSQIAIYIPLVTRQHFQLAESYTTNQLPLFVNTKSGSGTKSVNNIQKQRALDPKNFKLFIHVTFPYMACSDLDFSLDGATGDTLDKIHGVDAMMKHPTKLQELKIVRDNFQDDESKRASIRTACTFEGSFLIPRVGGSFAITIAREKWSQVYSVLSLFFHGNFPSSSKNQNSPNQNMTHFIHRIDFGEAFPHMDHPLKNTPTIFHFPIEEQAGPSFQNNVNKDRSGIGLSSITVKLVHTKYKRFARSVRDTYQMSVTQHTVTPSTLAQRYSTLLPGMNVIYDLTPFSVHHSESRENIFSFLGNLISIVGGVFVTVGLMSSCLLSAVNVAKKTD